MKLKYSLKGLDCAHCAQKIEDQLNKLDYVNECNIAFATTTLFLDVDENSFDEEKIKQVVCSIEPDVELVNQNSTNNEHDHEHHHHSCDCDHDHHHHSCDCNHEHNHHHDHEHHHDECGCGCHHDHHDEHVETIHHGDLKNAINININGLDCAHCAMKVEQEINKMDEVEDAMIIFSTETLKVKLNREMSDDELLKRLKNVIDKVESGITLSMKKILKL
ncbi:cation transporter [Coprobacillaceae bacterium CR2/5/TPMF4]|nr:cation transporter [Coprobacillaceae bacterium CR2/5/TPMF4]